VSLDEQVLLLELSELQLKLELLMLLEQLKFTLEDEGELEEQLVE